MSNVYVAGAGSERTGYEGAQLKKMKEGQRYIVHIV